MRRPLHGSHGGKRSNGWVAFETTCVPASIDAQREHCNGQNCMGSNTVLYSNAGLFPKNTMSASTLVDAAAHNTVGNVADMDRLST